MATLYIVATPIGNLEDITLRAIDVLKEEAGLILAEDTRVTKKLLSHYNIETPVQRLDANIESKIIEGIEGMFEEYQNIALVSDAGTPAISDPGSRFVEAAHLHDFKVVSIPGPSAVVSALSISGFPADKFVFLGFPPHKKGRQTFFKELALEQKTAVFYESPHRILKALESLKENLDSERKIAVARELTKMYEETVRGTTSEVLDFFEKNPDKVRGEFVVVVSAGA